MFEEFSKLLADIFRPLTAIVGTIGEISYAQQRSLSSVGGFTLQKLALLAIDSLLARSLMFAESVCCG